MRATTFDPTKAPWNVAEGGEPCAVLYVDWPGGAEYYGQRGWASAGKTVIERVVSWGSIVTKAMDMEKGGVGLTKLQGSVPSVNVSLRDDDKTFWLKCRDGAAIQGRTARVYLAAYGQQVDYFLWFEGVVAAPPSWAKGVLGLRLSSGDAHIHVEVGNLATAEDFASCYPDHRGRMLPIVFGQARRVAGVAVQHGRRGRFRQPCDADDTALYIEGFEDYPEDQEVTLWAGKEQMTGTFKGSRFTASSRGGGTIASGTTTAASDKDEPTYIHTDPNDLGTDPTAYIGYFLKMTVPARPSADQVGYEWLASSAYGHQMLLPLLDNKAGAEYRHIYAYDVDNDILRYAPAFTYEKTEEADENAGRGVTPGGTVVAIGHVWVPPNGASYVITTMAREHDRGQVVWEIISGGVVYVLADHAVQAVRAIYARGRKNEIPVPRKRPVSYITLGGGAPAIEGLDATGETNPVEDADEDWIEIPPDMYVLNLNDTSTFPGLGRAVTTVTFPLPLPCMPRFKFNDVELFADMEGYDDIWMEENPVTALFHILEDWAPTVPLDGDSFTAAAARTDWLDAAFALTTRMTAQELAAAMAWQSRCRALWKDGEIHVDYLRNSAPGTLDMVINTQYEEGSHEFGWRGMQNIATELRYKVTIRGETKEFVEEDASAVAKYGRRSPGVKEFWVLQNQDHAAAVARFWLNRLKTEALRVRIRTPLNAARVEIGDWIRLWSYEFFSTYKALEVIGVTDDPGGGGAAVRSPSVTLDMMEPYGWDVWACPSGDTCIGCELYCEVAADVLPCVVSADLGCDVFDLDGHAGWNWERVDRFFDDP